MNTNTIVWLNEVGWLDYISWSRMQTFLKSKSAYTDRYIYNKPTFETKEMRFWKNFHELMEIAPPEFMKEYDEGLSELDCRETLECIGRPDITVRSIIDKVIDDRVVEFKTGKNAWTMEDVENHWQLYIEHFVLHGLEDWEAELVWVPTKDNGTNIEHKDEKYSYKIEIKKEKKLEWLNKIVETYDKIIDFHKNLWAIDLRAERRWELMQQVEAINNEIKELDGEVLEDLKAWKQITCDFGTYYMTRKNSTVIVPKTEEEKNEVSEIEQEIDEAKDKIDKKMKEFYGSPVILALESEIMELNKKLDRFKEVQEKVSIWFRKKN